MNRRVLKTLSFLAPTWIATALTTGCSSGSGGSHPVAKEQSSAPTTSPYTLKVLQTGPGGATNLLQFPPAEVAAAAHLTQVPLSGSAGAGTQAAIAPPLAGGMPGTAGGIQPEDLTIQPSTPNSLPNQIADPHLLIFAAAAECGMTGDYYHVLQSLPPAPDLQRILQMEEDGSLMPTLLPTYPWAHTDDFSTLDERWDGFYLFAGVASREDPVDSLPGAHFPGSCDQELQYTETLVCIADKLAQLADSVGPVVYNAPDPSVFLQIPSGDAGPPPVVTWTIPPPQNEDKFIVRDLAINVLAHVPWMDSLQMPLTGQQCSTLYANWTADASSNANSDTFGVSTGPTGAPGHYPPFLVTGRTINEERLAFEAGLLRSAEQLLHDLVREQVYSDLAGMASAEGSADDPVAGQSAAADINLDAPYNSLGHVARVLLGRWEMDPVPPPGATMGGGEPDPMCHQGNLSGTPETQLMSLADPEMRARALDLGTDTQSQASATTLFERAGLVVPDGTPANQLGALLTAQLEQLAAAGVDGGGAATYAQTAGGQAIAALVSRLSDSDLARAAKHNRTTFTMLTGLSTSDSSNLTPAMLNPLGLTTARSAPQLSPQGIAIDNGLSRALVSIDPMARVGAMMTASQCQDFFGYYGAAAGESGGSIRTESDVDSRPFTGLLPSSGFQDVFAIGQAIRSRLVQLRELASSFDSHVPAADDSARAAAIAEAGAWSGTGRMLLTTDLFDSPAPVSAGGVNSSPPELLLLDFVGVDPGRDLGITNLTDWPANAVMLVAGGATNAECAANLRVYGCPASIPILPYTTFGPRPYVPGPPSVAAGRNVGVTNQSYELVFPAPVGPSYAPDTLIEQTYWVVAGQDPAKPAGVGMVLGALRLPTYDVPAGMGTANRFYGTAMVPLAPMRRELVYDAFGLGKWVGAAPPHAGELAIAQPPLSCAGVQVDQFVPLQNDLTDTSDAYENSWSHYLSLAQQAATNADNLGQQLVDVGFQETQTAEGAAEQALTQVGSLPNVADISVNADGTLDAGPSNGALSDVLSMPMFDAVFFGHNPGAAGLSHELGCDVGSANTGVCQKLAALTSSGGPPTFIDPTEVDSMGRSADGGAPLNGATPSSANPSFVYTALNLQITGGPSPIGGGNNPTGPATESCQNAAAAVRALHGVTAGGFSSANFNAGITPADAQGQQVLNGSSLAATIDNTHFTVDDFNPVGSGAQYGHWRLVVGSTTVMDSDDPNFWPACLTQGAPAPCLSDPLVSAYNDMFRVCPAGSTQSALGASTCVGSPLPQGTSAANAELNALRWRVEGALWTAAAMSGKVPAGMFAGPIPAVNWASQPVGSAGSLNAPINAFFGNAAFTASGSGPALSSAPFTATSIPAGENANLNPHGVAPLQPPTTSRYFQWDTLAAKQVPLWLLTLYGNAGTPVRGSAPFSFGGQSTNIVHIFAENPAGTPSYDHLNNYIAQLTGLSKPADGSIDPGIWSNIIGRLKLDSQSCADVGSPMYVANDPTQVGVLQGFVATIKTDFPTSNDDLRQEDRGARPGLWSPTYDFTGGGFAFQLPHNCGGSNPSCTATGGASLSSPPAPSTWLDQSPVYMNFCNGNCLPEQSFDALWSPTNGQNFGQGLDWGERYPSKTDPDHRLRYALNSGAPASDCDAAWQLTQAMALSCLLTVDLKQHKEPVVTEPQQINSVSDLDGVTSFLDGQISQLQQTIGNAYVTNVPFAVVASAMQVPGALSSISGKAGQDATQGANALLSVFQEVNTMVEDATLISYALDGFRDAVDQANISANQQSLQNQIASWQTAKSVVDDNVQILHGIGEVMNTYTQSIPAGGSIALGNVVLGAADIIGGIGKLGIDGKIAGVQGQLAEDVDASLSAAINKAANDVNQQLVQLNTGLTNAGIAFQQNINTITASTIAMSADRNEAAYYAGKASGAEVWKCNLGQDQTECHSSVNTVLNRRYQGTEIRYEEALKNAKAAAYVARLAIEQRLGVRLSDLTAPVGTLAAPSSWADNVCHLTGVNYKRLEQQVSSAAASSGDLNAQVSALDTTIAGEFADAFIGDYVQELQDFVNFYNVANPEQDGNDTAVLSFRESLLGTRASCQQPSPNLLVDSSRLYTNTVLAAGDSPLSVGGWVMSPCSPTDAVCLQTKSLGAFQLPATPGGVTWFQAIPQTTSDAGAADAGISDASLDGTAASSGGPPDNIVYQQVNIDNPGTYVLSWWDQALDGNANPTTQGAPYQVQVYDSSWTPLPGFASAASGSTDDSGASWSTRRSVHFEVSSPNIYYIAFGASASSANPGGGVAISDVQLEVGSTPRPYVDTDSTGMTSASGCTLSPSDLRSLFVHNCDPDGTCHYDLTTPITIDTGSMTANGQSIAGKLATGNFNFRHVNVALNVVGTGVLDCTATGSPDCYGSGFLQYQLIHDGTVAGVLGADGVSRTFNFGMAKIDHAKAIAAERYITTPISSADQSLIGQLEAVQFRGRPLDGEYYLRIYDAPSLNFNNLQDIQLILNYHYWSQVSTSP